MTKKKIEKYHFFLNDRCSMILKYKKMWESIKVVIPKMGREIEEQKKRRYHLTILSAIKEKRGAGWCPRVKRGYREVSHCEIEPLILPSPSTTATDPT